MCMDTRTRLGRAPGASGGEFRCSADPAGPPGGRLPRGGGGQGRGQSGRGASKVIDCRKGTREEQSGLRGAYLFGCSVSEFAKYNGCWCYKCFEKREGILNILARSVGPEASSGPQYRTSRSGSLPDATCPDVSANGGEQSEHGSGA